RLDQVIELCEDHNMILSLNLWFHSYLSETVWGGGNIRWYTNPYQTVTHAADFYRSKLAWEYQEKLYRYFIARWSYSRALGIWFIVDEVNGTDGWITGDSLVAAQWGNMVHDYFKRHDPYQHLTTGTRSGGITQYWHQGYQIFDIASREIYEAQGFPIAEHGTLDSSAIHPLKHSYDNYAGEIRKLWFNYEKPAIIGETGWDHTFYEPDMPGYLAQYHNALWASLATGAAMTPFWWSYSGRVNDNVISRQLRSFRRFVNRINFPSLTALHPVHVTTPGDGFALRSPGLLFGWIVNPKSDVAGDSVVVHLDSLVRSDQFLYADSSSADSTLLASRILSIDSAGIPTANWSSGDTFSLKIYHTWGGRMIHESEVLVKESQLRFEVPILYTTGSHANYVGHDVAFILEKN
ncbi:MAG: hypothetical protein OEQ53_09780, partial [Saprospiraceae bacterium]|nr:hypothetical protein [Saprospiraceae bacterium]